MAEPTHRARVHTTPQRFVIRSIAARVVFLCALVLTPLALRVAAQARPPDWQVQLRNYCDASDWPSAMHVLAQQIALAPNDLDLKAWHARVLAWSGNLHQAQREYLAILSASRNDPDVWAGL